MSLSSSTNQRPDRGELLELLRLRRCALQRELALQERMEWIDDDLLPTQVHVEDGLVEIDLALERERRGRYGLCTCCGQPIDFERLLAHPAASRCWPCAEAEDSVPNH